MSYGVGLRCGLDPKLLWLWRRLTIVAPIRPLAWELPYAMSVALKRKKKSILSKLNFIPKPNVWCYLQYYS